MKVWFNDFMLHACDSNELSVVLDPFLTICAERSLNVSAKKSSLFATSVKWCGTIIEEHGTRMDPRNLDEIAHAVEPQTADEISKFIHCAQWMVHNIPDSASRAQPLR